MKIGDTLRAGDAQFRAFVSYSHADAAIAKKLHRKMETYRLPKLLREMQTGGSENGRLGRLFRDREDLPAALDLSESVKTALAQSRALIVLCSPNAKDSPWVAKEIALFRELHPDRPILAALVDGEPEESFPSALLEGGEPLAADLRKQGDGWRLGLLKLIAGVAEVPLDALVQRDAQRHIRSVMAVTGGVLVALLAMIGMTTYALQQRNEAQHQQAQAEGLVEYMLTDLRSELKGASTLRVMTKVNERAMDYYEDQGDLSDMSAESLERRARILHAMGEDDEKRGDLDKALEKFTEAHRVTEVLLARDPDNADRIFGHAQSEYWVGYARFEQNNLKQAMPHFHKYRDLAYKLIEIDPKSDRGIKEVGFAEGNLCAIALQKPARPKAAILFCNRATSQFEKLQAAESNQPALMSDLANRYGWDADAFLANGQIDMAIKRRNEQLKILERANKLAPDSQEILQNLMLAQMSQAELNLKSTKLQIAKNMANEANANFIKLKIHDPDNAKWQEWGKRINDLKEELIGE